MKARRERLYERYVGKKALVDTWLQVQGWHDDYTMELKKRVDGHKRDLVNRGYL